MSFNYGDQPTFGESQPAAIPHMQELQHSHDEVSILKAPVAPVAMEQTLSALAENQHPMTQPLSADEIFKPIAAPIAPEAPMPPVAPLMAEFTAPPVAPSFEATQSLSARVAEMEAHNANLERENAILRNDLARLEANAAELESLRAKTQRLDGIAQQLQGITAQLQG